MSGVVAVAANPDSREDKCGGHGNAEPQIDVQNGPAHMDIVEELGQRDNPPVGDVLRSDRRDTNKNNERSKDDERGLPLRAGSL